MSNGEVCGWPFQFPRDLNNHKKRPHPVKKPEKKFVCDVCQERYSQEHTLVRHKRLKHSKTLLKCSKCHRVFKDKEEHDQHIQDEHPADEFLCKHCEHLFTETKTLDRHQKEFAYEIECWKNGCGKLSFVIFIINFQYFSEFSQALDSYLADDHDEKEMQDLAEIVGSGFAGVDAEEKTGRVYLLVDERLLDGDSDVADFIAAGFYVGSSKNNDSAREGNHKTTTKAIFNCLIMNARFLGSSKIPANEGSLAS